MKRGTPADLDKMQIGIIGCLPKDYAPTPPGDQKNCTTEDCPACKKEMWVSEAKRELRVKYPKLVAMCMRCAVIAMKMLEDEDGDEGVHVDISKLKK